MTLLSNLVRASQATGDYVCPRHSRRCQDNALTNLAQYLDSTTGAHDIL